MYYSSELHVYYHCRALFAFVAYFIAGMVIMKMKYEKTGSDIIPNEQFWMSLPFLIKVGDDLCV